MKKHLLLSAVLSLAVSSGLYAGTVTLSDAQTVALNFYKGTSPNTGTGLAASLKYTSTSGTNAPDFYVFDISPARGFVIVAGDDRVIPILGYSTEGYFRTDFRHVGLQKWVHKTAANIRLALQNNVGSDAAISSQWTAYRQGANPLHDRSAAVSPLCATTWDQENDITYSPPPYLYNLLCPYYAPDTQRALTGCEATAMAQIMKYWNYPARGIGSYTYDDDTVNYYSHDYGIQSSDFAAHTYQWDSMPRVLTGQESLAQDSAVDVLMYDCAVSVGMDFGDDNQDGSAANALIYSELEYDGDSICVQYALVKYFAYDADTIRGVLEVAYTPAAWTALIEHELNVGRPVLYEGFDSIQGGHAWVCDGYDATDRLHMNWGWGGSDNGYFAINNLTTSGNFNPIDSDDALIGIMPKVAHAAGIATVSTDVSFQMSPNPASHAVILQTSQTGGGLTWSIKNTLGQILISTNVESAQTSIDVAGLASGMYLVELHSGDRSSVRKLIISK